MCILWEWLFKCLAKLPLEKAVISEVTQTYATPEKSTTTGNHSLCSTNVLDQSRYIMCFVRVRSQHIRVVVSTPCISAMVRKYGSPVADIHLLAAP